MLTEEIVSLSRLQFGGTAMFHFLFVPLTLGLAWLLVVMELAFVLTKKTIYRDMTQFWGKLFGINFVMGVTTGLTMEFQFGTNWAHYSHYVGDIFGTPLAIEGLMAFFLESTMVGLFFFGWDRLSPKVHLLATTLVALGSNLSALWILVANGWMQNPVGAHFNPVTSRMELSDISTIIFNPMAQDKFFHTVTAGYMAASMFVMGISAWYLLKGKNTEFAKRSIGIAAGFAMVTVCALILMGDQSGIAVAHTQPTKLAAMEGEWETSTAPAAFNVIAWPDQRAEKNDFALKIPYALGILVTHSTTETIPGITNLEQLHRQRVIDGIKAYDGWQKIARGDQSGWADFNQHQDNLGYALLLKRYTDNPDQATPQQIDQAVKDSIPEVAPIFWTFRLMVAIGGILLLLVLWTFVQAIRRRGWSRWHLKALLFAIPLPWIAIESGWFVAEYGRQPWSITHVLPTAISASHFTVGHLAFSIIAIGAIYLTLFCFEMFLMVKFARKGPATIDPNRYTPIIEGK